MKSNILYIILFTILLVSCKRVSVTTTYKILSKDSIKEHTEIRYPSEYCVWCGDFVIEPRIHLYHMAFHNPKKEIDTIPTTYRFIVNNKQELFVSKERWESKNVNDTINQIEYKWE